MTTSVLVTITPAELPQGRREAVDRETLHLARNIVDDVRTRGEAALREHAERFGDIDPGEPLFLTPSDLVGARVKIGAEELSLLERTAERIRRFAQAQRAALTDVEVPIPGGVAGHSVAPVERAGCYAPGGRFPLPSSVLMTAVTARAAGVQQVWVASPHPAPVTLAAAAVAQVDGLIAAGGAQAIAAMAYGAGQVPPCDAVVGPGNRFVTAGKQLVAGHVAIDMLAGPSELVVLADGTADPAVVASDLLAQAEHDPDALPILVATAPEVAGAVNAELEAQLAELPAGTTARLSLGQGFAVVAEDIDAAVAVCDALAPEHLELCVVDPQQVASRCRHYGALFIGQGAAEVLGDYGAGPNHTLPTGGTARHAGGLSVFTFLRIRTWLRVDDAKAALPLVRDAERLAGLEGLTAHARSAARRRPR